ncbi:MAG TPA: FAD-linked oxidase C-terminal domain-containing protein [Candidatus Dormibacteraeota bacterium]|nr:FAD-linked oxidase C-terminal domain-containing protein [Candidatus Dormibacteraeota bacterium]
MARRRADGTVDEARRELVARLGADAVVSDPTTLGLYRRDASIIEGGCALVALPRTATEVQACVAVAARHGLAVVPRGSGTGLAGGATPLGDALVVVTTRMARILEVRAEDRLAWVEPGVLNLDLAEAVRPQGLTFAPDPSSQQASTVGGNVATNAGGPHCLLHGVTSGHVLALDLVLADGSLVRLGAEGPLAAGYDLRGIVVGSEGTFGIVTAICVRLTPLAPAVRTILVAFPDPVAAARCVAAAIAEGLVAAAMECMDAASVHAVEQFVHAGYPEDAGAVLLVELEGLPRGIDRGVEELGTLARAHGATSVRVAADEAERARLWKGRKSALGAMARYAPHYYLHDCVVPRTRLPEILEAVYAIAARHRLLAVNMFHAGDGNLHPLFVFDRREDGVLERVLAGSREILELCVRAGGVVSGEHGIGLEKRDFLPLLFSPADLGAQACVRQAFDPERRMNPHKVLPAGARCGDFAMARGGGDLARTVAGLPEGTWI